MSASSIDFWDDSLDQNRQLEDRLELMHEEKLYPPRLEMTVQLLREELRSVVLSVSFEGCCSDRDSPKFQIILPLG